MKTLYDCKPGDTVFIVSRQRYSSEPIETTVEKVGRKLITVKAHHYGEKEFRLETGDLNDKGFSFRAHLYTADQLEDKKRRDERDIYLSSLGISRFSLRQAHDIRWTADDMDKLYNFLKTLEP